MQGCFRLIAADEKNWPRRDFRSRFFGKHVSITLTSRWEERGVLGLPGLIRLVTSGEERGLSMANWEDLTMPGLEALRQQTRTVLLPIGSLEEHGPHLPLGTDTFYALEVARRVARLCPVAVAPPLFYGMCRSTREHPGTVSISGDALRALLLSVGREFCRQGWHNLVFISGHAGGTHISAIVETAERLLAELPEARVAVVNLLELLREIVSDRPDLVKTRGDSHAGEVETAIMMAAYPDLVRGTAPEEWPRFPRYVLVRDKRRYWPGGVWGNPAPATPAQGEAILTAEVDKLVSIIRMLDESENG